MHAQPDPPPIQWQASFGGTGGDELFVIRQTSDGGYILGGASDSGQSGNKTSGTFGGSDYWLIKLGYDGTKQWETNYGGTSSDGLIDVELTSDGGYILGGNATSGADGNKASPNYGYSDFWVLKLDASGRKEWEANCGGSDVEQFKAIRQTRDGGYILAGESKSIVSGNKTSSTFGGNDYWVVKLNSDGSKLWETNYGGSQRELVHDLQPTSDGGCIVVGDSESGPSGNKTSGNFGWADVWIVKLDASGVKQWEADYGGQRWESVNSIMLSDDGGYVLCGASTSPASGNKTSPNYGNYDLWLLKLDADGAKQWEGSFGGADWDVGLRVRGTRDGGYILGGYSESIASGNKTSGNFGGFDAWVVKVNANGSKEWDLNYGGTAEDMFGAIEPTRDGGYILGGRSASLASGNKTSPNFGGYDFWVVKLAGPPRLVPTSLQRLGDGAFQFQISGGATGQIHQVESSTNFASWDWLITITNNGMPTNVVDHGAMNSNRRFYRVR